MIEHIEKVKSEYTDKYVAVDASRPELARFRDLVGQVKTVNMSGRALVEFIEYNVNIGWFDIDLDYLKVVDKPAPKPKAEKKPAAKKKPSAAAAKSAGGDGGKKLSPLELARQQGAGGGASKPAKSTADILAAARGGAKAGAPAAKSEKPAEAAAKPAKAGGKMSTADILAAARGGAAEPAAAEPEPAVAEPESEPAQAPAAGESSAPASSDGPVRVDRASMNVDEMLAYCRERDAE